MIKAKQQCDDKSVSICHMNLLCIYVVFIQNIKDKNSIDAPKRNDIKYTQKDVGWSLR